MLLLQVRKGRHGLRRGTCFGGENRKEYEPMNIRDLLKPESVLINANVESKEQAITALIDLHDRVGNLLNKEAYTPGSPEERGGMRNRHRGGNGDPACEKRCREASRTRGNYGSRRD